MKSSEKTAFLSCSFSEEDAGINNLVKSICDGLSIKYVNVSYGYPQTPPETARRLIADSHMFIAVITKREETTDNTFNMPPSVHDEISMAFALKKPMLLIRENEVDVKGFLSNYGTYVSFSRSDLWSPGLLRTLISSIHNLKIETIEPHDLVPSCDISHYYAKSLTQLTELVKKNDGFVWKYFQNRNLVFKEKFEGVIHGGAWATIPCKETSEHIIWDCKINKSSRDFKLDFNVLMDTPDRLDYTINISPPPIPGDHIEFAVSYESKYFNALFKKDTDRVYEIGGKSFDCFDGIIPIQKTDWLKCQYRFPKEYPLQKEAVSPAVSSHSSGIDPLVESETNRLSYSVEDFGGNLVITLSIQDPLLRHLYGIAWNTIE
jgi:hypothetical protein